MATIKPVVPDVPKQVVNVLIEMFRSVAKKKPVTQKGAKQQKEGMRIDEKVHLAKYISELVRFHFKLSRFSYLPIFHIQVKFGLLPRAEGLACLRSLLVDLRHHKVDMICAMIESMGYFLYNLPETHAKMRVIAQVLIDKSGKIKDERQKV